MKYKIIIFQFPSQFLEEAIVLKVPKKLIPKIYGKTPDHLQTLIICMSKSTQCLPVDEEQNFGNLYHLCYKAI